MGVFVDYPSNMFTGIKNIPVTIATADTNVLLINSITICNLGGESIRLFLKKTRTQTPNPASSIFLVNEFEIKGYNTIDIVAAFGLQIFLTYSVTPSISDSLVCFSNGYSQLFDCEVTYTKLNELPN